MSRMVCEPSVKLQILILMPSYVALIGSAELSKQSLE